MQYRRRDLLVSISRSAGACPPRSSNLNEKRPRPRDRTFFVPLAAWRGTGPRPTLAVAFLLARSAMACPSRVSRYSVSRRKPFINRSAGACPPRSSDLPGKRTRSRGRGRFLCRSQHSEGQALALRWQWRFLCPLARWPVPRAFLGILCRAENPSLTVARGPVPRDRPTDTKNARGPEAADVFCAARSMARDRPSPYVGRGVSSVL